jgi:threonine synthase
LQGIIVKKWDCLLNICSFTNVNDTVRDFLEKIYDERFKATISDAMDVNQVILSEFRKCMTMIWAIQKIFSSFTSFSDAETKP